MAETLDLLIAHWEPKFRDAFIDAIMMIRDAAQINLIVVMIERGDIDGAVRAVGLDPVMFRAFDRTYSDAFEAAGSATTDAFPKTKDDEGRRLAVLFDIRNFRAEQWLRRQSSDLITDVIDDQKQAIRLHLEAGMAAGENPRTVALDLVGRVNKVTGQREGGVVGLTSTMVGWSQRYAQDLAELKGSALTRTLRDKRFDRQVASAIKEGTPLPVDVRTKMVMAYRNRALQYRGETIARSEAITGLHQAQSEATQQAIDKGQFTEDAVTKVWHSAEDIRVREQHRHLDGQRVPYRGTFKATDGEELRFPGDPNASAGERINCRCWLEMKVNYLKGVK